MIYKNESGFSLIELIVVIGILTFILSLGLITNFDAFNGTIFREERLNVLSVLEKARTRSINNYNEASHGVCLDTTNANSPRYVNFQGTYSSSNPLNEYLPVNPSVKMTSTINQFSCSTGGIIFSQLSGKTGNIDITITQNGRSSMVSTNIQGRIDW